MRRYIDADLLLAQCRRNPLFEKTEKDKGMIYIERSIIDAIPTADVVEVVRCCDCKHNVANWQHDELDIEDYTDIVCDYFMTDGMEANDYCSHGERSGNGT
jgi:hypothetical protein